mgnify:CR=1 FL=1
MRFAVIPLIVSAALHVVGFILVNFAETSLFLIFPAVLYCVLSIFLLRGATWAAWLTLLCMIGGIAGTCIEFMGPLIAPLPVLVGIIASDAAVAGLLVRALWLDRKPRDSQ